MHGLGSIRIRRMQASWQRCFQCVTTVALATLMLSLIFVAPLIAHADESSPSASTSAPETTSSDTAKSVATPSAPDLSLDEVLIGLQAAEARLRNMACDVSSVDKRFVVLGDFVHVEERGTGTSHLAEVGSQYSSTIAAGNWITESSGRSRMKRFLKPNTRSNQSGSEVDWESCFNGIEARHVLRTKQKNGTWVKAAFVSDGFDDLGPAPLEFTTHYKRLPISRVLKIADGAVVGRESWEDQTLIIVETTALNGRKIQFWIDPQRGFVVLRRCVLVRTADDQPWEMESESNAREYVEAAPGIWLPQRVELRQYRKPRPNGELPSLSCEVIGHFSNWRVNQDLPPDQFRLAIPVGVRIQESPSNPSPANPVPAQRRARRLGE